MSELNDDGPEGATPLDPDELEGLKLKYITRRDQLNEVEQINIDQGKLWLSQRRSNEVLTESFVRQLHVKMLGHVWEWAGTFRKTEKNIGIDPLQIGVQLHNLLGDCEYWIEHETYASLELAARFHHRLVQIHLFPNGNGRHARIMADEILKTLLKEKPVDWSAGYDLNNFNERREQYIQALRNADGGDYQSLFEFVGIKSED